MEPFSIPNPLRNLTGPYPKPCFVLDAAERGGEPARIALVRLWLSEGIPYAFRECPAIYEPRLFMEHVDKGFQPGVFVRSQPGFS